MSSIAQIVSEMAHSVQQADSLPVRRALKLGLIHSRNEIIRKDNNNNKSTDKVLQQRFRLTLVDVPDGDNTISKDAAVGFIKRTTNKVPRPTRLNNGVPFHSVRTMGVRNPLSIAFVKEASSNFYAHLPGMCGSATYDHINDYIYIDTMRNSRLALLKHIIIESVFEYPQLIETETSNGILNIDDIDDNDEFFLPEDMVNSVKLLTLQTFNPQVVRQTNEIPTPNLVK